MEEKIVSQYAKEFKCNQYVISSNGYIYYIMESVKLLQKSNTSEPVYVLLRDKYTDGYIPMIIGMEYTVDSDVILQYRQTETITNILCKELNLNYPNLYGADLSKEIDINVQEVSVDYSNAATTDHKIIPSCELLYIGEKKKPILARWVDRG